MYVWSYTYKKDDIMNISQNKVSYKKDSNSNSKNWYNFGICKKYIG